LKWLNKIKGIHVKIVYFEFFIIFLWSYLIVLNIFIKISSFRPLKQIKGTLIGAFLRLIYHSQDMHTAFHSSLELMMELTLLQYTRPIFMQIIRRLQRSHSHPVWPHIISYLRTIQKTDDLFTFLQTSLKALDNPPDEIRWMPNVLSNWETRSRLLELLQFGG